uniref:Uncharacterized protein n=1 Tax=Romanomermis culicivorax TaxID=13658 RepID=A0A915L654_ROMCU
MSQGDTRTELMLFNRLFVGDTCKNEKKPVVNFCQPVRLTIISILETAFTETLNWDTYCIVNHLHQDIKQNNCFTTSYPVREICGSLLSGAYMI